MSAATTPESIKGRTVVSLPDAIDLHSNANNNVKFIDGSWYLKGRNGRDEFQEGPRIEGANFFDIDDISTPSHLPHMMPPKQLFAAAMDAMGITNQDHIIVYGAKDCVSIR
jgi:3-mercaptopyruvate sulfurtransferase SseA